MAVFVPQHYSQLFLPIIRALCVYGYRRMNLLSQKIKELSGLYSIENFEWEIPEDCPVDIPASDINGLRKNIYLKENLKNIVTEDQSLKTHYWIIQKWGGIGSFKKNERNDKRINKFIKELGSGKLTKDNFSCISSLSKVASFLEPDKYVIYDSRVIYALNWLLFNFSDSRKLFPQPIGRSAALAKYDMQTIFRLAGEEVEYYSHKEAFHEYCKLIRDLSPKNSPPYFLEMFIFMIAPTWVIQDIQKSTTLTISHT